MKSQQQIQQEIDALARLGQQCKSDELAQASIQGQIDVLMWISDYACTVGSPRC